MMGNKTSKGKERLVGAVLSYANTVFNMAITLLLVPLILHACGESDYSVYKVMSSFASPLSIINFGIAVYVSRGIAQCNQRGEDNSSDVRRKIMGMSLLVSAALFAIAIAVSIGFYCSIDGIYGKTFNAHELELAKKLFAIMALNISLHIIDNGFQGCLIGNERFIAVYGITFARTVLKGVLIALLIIFGCSVTVVALIDLSLTLFALVMKVFYTTFVLREKYRFTDLDKSELKIFFLFASAMILQTIVNNVNQTMDNVILGAMISDKSIITMYSSALSINTMFISVSYVFSGIYHPKIIRAVEAKDSPEELTKKAVQPAKYQAIVSSLFCIGFALFGKNFITLWIGEKYISAYYVCLCLMVPAYLVSVSGIYEAFLDAKLKRLTRSLILLGMAVYNAAVTIILVNFIGYWGAAIGTATSFIIGNLIIMNAYASKVSGVSVIKLYCGAFSGTWKAIVLSLAVGVPMAIFLPRSTVWFLIKVLAFTAVYALIIWTVGLKKDERTRFASLLSRK